MGSAHGGSGGGGSSGRARVSAFVVEFDSPPEVGAPFDKIRPSSALGDDQEAVAAFNNVLDVWEFVTRTTGKRFVARSISAKSCSGIWTVLVHDMPTRDMTAPCSERVALPTNRDSYPLRDEQGELLRAVVSALCAVRWRTMDARSETPARGRPGRR